MKNSLVNRLFRSIALAISFFLLFTYFSSIADSQTITWKGARAACFNLAVSATQVSCPAAACSSGQCDNCLTLDITNLTIVGSPCDITKLEIVSGNCFSICCPAAFGAPSSTACDNLLKDFTGHFPQGSPTLSFTICHTGTNPVTFQVYEAAGTGAGCCTRNNTNTNYYEVTF